LKERPKDLLVEYEDVCREDEDDDEEVVDNGLVLMQL
jgi:hypothetical protein